MLGAGLGATISFTPGLRKLSPASKTKKNKKKPFQ